MPFCTQCGTQVSDTDLYCAKCGARQVAGPATGAAAGAAPKPAPGAAPPPGGTPPPRASAPPPPRPAADPFASVSPRSASILCYIPFVGWVAAIVVLASNTYRYNRTVRFHAFQGLYLFVAWLFIQWVFSPLCRIGPGPHMPIVGLLQMGMLAVWIFMIVKTSHEQVYSLPIIGDLAERSMAER